VKVDLKRASVITILIGAVLFALLAAGGVYAALDAPDRATRIVGFCVAGLFTLPLVMMAFALKRLLQPRGLHFDERGIHYWQGESSLLLPWDEVAAVGIGYEQPPNLPSIPSSIEDAVAGFVKEKIKEAVKLDDKRRFAVEIFPVDAAFADRYPLIARYRREQQPPAAGLPALRWRLLIPPLAGAARDIGRGVQTYRPQLWIGWFARPWGSR
jgi:hypothetical protein